MSHAAFRGSVLTISRGEVCSLGAVATVGCGLILVHLKELCALVYHREIAAPSGVPERL